MGGKGDPSEQLGWLVMHLTLRFSHVLRRQKHLPLDPTAKPDRTPVL